MMFKSYILIVFIVNFGLSYGQESGCQSPRLQTGEKGHFSSTNYPQNYNSNSKCEWLITVPSTKIIKLTFNKTFQLEGYDECYDSVKVFIGSNSSHLHIGEYCGFIAPRRVIVNSNQVLVTFESNDEKEYNGFSVEWEAVVKVTDEPIESGCNTKKIQSGERGVISSMNYPSKYLPLANCEWLIIVPTTKVIKLTFNDSFELEKMYTSYCIDSVKIFKGSSSNNANYDEYCGEIAPGPIFVNSNQAVINFYSDSESQFKGFSVQWEAVNSTVDQEGGCKSPRLQTGEKGHFSNINDPQRYNSNSKCEWLITVSSTKIIKLTFNETFLLQMLFSCDDSLKVFIGSNSNNAKFGEYCGRIAPRPVIVNSNQVLVTYNGLGIGRYIFTTFSVQWEAVDKLTDKSTDVQQSGCHSPRFQSGERGIISSMNYPKKYERDANCEWWITIPTTKKLKMKFIDKFNLGRIIFSSCYDFIEVIKVANLTSERIAKYCGEVTPNPIFVNGDYVFVRFQSNYQDEFEGFSIEWSAVDKDMIESKDELNSGCNSPRYQNGERGIISSINYPQKYIRFANCVWYITVPSTNIIVLTFNDKFNLQSYGAICSDSVEFFKGANLSSERIGKYCGKVAPKPIFVNGNQVVVRFQSDEYSIQREGFSVEWSAVGKGMNESLIGQQSGCKSPKTQYGVQGIFSSINYPQFYNSLSKCEWLITVPSAKIIKLTFNVNFWIETNWKTGICYDSVKVFKGSNSSVEKIGEYCGSVAPGPIYVNSNQAFITFNSDIAVERKGFSVQWQAVSKITSESTAQKMKTKNSNATL